MKEESLFDQRPLAEREELPNDVLVSCAVEGVCDERAIARPCVCIGIASELRDVEVSRRNDGSAVVGVGARGEDAPPVQLRYVGAKLLVDVAMVLLGPHLPVRSRPPEVDLRTAADDEVLTICRDLAQAGTHAEPVGKCSGFACSG